MFDWIKIGFIAYFVGKNYIEEYKLRYTNSACYVGEHCVWDSVYCYFRKDSSPAWPVYATSPCQGMPFSPIPAGALHSFVLSM